MMRWSICLILMLLFPVSMQAQNNSIKDNGSFVKILCDKEKLVVGDSCLLTFVVYAPQPFVTKGKPSGINVRNGDLRKLRIGKQNLQRVVEGRYIYYALVVEQYVMRTVKPGNVEIGERSFDLEMHVQTQSADPFDLFFGNPVRVKKVPSRALSEKFVIKVTEKPKRTMMEMKQSGIQVL